jgi:5-methylcytosine-specific restriction enzyme subunit McrC
MSTTNLIQVFEYQKLRIGEQGFEKKHFDAIVKFNEQNKNKYFTPIYNGVQFVSYVGVIKIGKLTIEILPKADKNNSDSQETKNTWQTVLLKMLSVCKKIKIDTVSETQLKKRYNSILEAYFEMYLTEIEQLIHHGLIKQYRRKQSNQLALKGKLMFAQNIQKNAVHKEKFFCEHQVYDKNHLIHEVLLQGLTVLDSLSNSQLTDRIKRVSYHFYSVKKTNITVAHFDRIKLNRKSQPYERALNIAKMLILNYSPNISSGQDNMLTLLFDMNQLWEEYIFRILNKHKPANYTVSFQNSDVFWESKTIRPDIVITNPENENFVIDTKWKVLKTNSKPDDADLKQMFVYNLHWKAKRSMLLYPQTTQLDSSFGKYKHQPTHLFENDYQAIENECKLGFVSVLDGNSIKEGEVLSREIFGKMGFL